MSRPPRSSKPSFRPRFTLGLFYLVLFFALYCVLLALPDLFAAAADLPAGPGFEAVARQRGHEAARGALEGRLHWAIAAALVTTGLGLYARVLPGVR